jgi:hypothetical protein
MLVKITWNPSNRQLRQFGACALVALPLLGWLVQGRTSPAGWTTAQTAIFGVFAGLGALGGLLALLRPQALKPAFVVLTLATMPIGIVVGELVLLIVYFAVFTPVALLFRLIGRDALERRLKPEQASYWTPKTQANGVRQYFRQS